MIQGAEQSSERPFPSMSSGDDGAPGMQRIAANLVEMAELQWTLLRLDADAATTRITRTLVLVVAGACLGLAAAPVGLLAFASWLHEAAGWSIPVSRLASAGAGLASALVVLLYARRSLGMVLRSFDRSLGELAQNRDWLKRKFKDSSRSI